MLYSLFQKILGRPGFDPSLGWEDPLEKGMTTHSNIFAWREEPVRLKSIGLQRVGHN